MTVKTTLIVPMTLLATLAAGVLVHDWLRTKPSVENAAPTRAGTVAMANPDGPAPVSPPPVSAPAPTSQEANLVQDVAPTRTASISTAEPPAPAPVSPPPVSAPAPATPEPPPRMTASQEAGLDAWMIKTYLGCWKPVAQPVDADRYIARVRLKFKPDGSLLKPPKLVNPPSDPAQKPQAKSVLQAVKACDPLPMPAQYRSFYEQWKIKTILFDPQVAAR
jgi:colicin import membrane protein